MAHGTTCLHGERPRPVVASPAGLTSLYIRYGFLLMGLYGGVNPVMALSGFEPDLAHMDLMVVHDVRSPRHVENDVLRSHLAQLLPGKTSITITTDLMSLFIPLI